MAPRRRRGKKGVVACKVTDKYDQQVRVTTIVSDGQPDIEVMQCFNSAGQQSSDLSVEQAALSMGHFTVCKQVFASKEAMELSTVRDPLCLALQKGNVEISQLIINAGSNVNSVLGMRSPISYALDNEECSKEIIQLVIEAGFPKNGIVNQLTKETTLHVAASRNFICVVKYLLSISVNVNAKDVNRRTPLHVAVKRNNPHIVEMLVKKGAKINSVCKENFTPLFYAIITGNCNMVKFLIKCGADLHHLSLNPKCSLMPLHLGAFMGHVNVVKLLLDNGADINKIVPKTGETALHIVAKAENFTRGPKSRTLISMKCMAEMLIREGSDLKLRQLEGFTPLQIALRGKNLPVAKMLIRSGSELNNEVEEEDKPSSTTFHLIAETLDKELIKMSLEYGANCWLLNGEGLYPCQVAMRKYSNDTKHLFGKSTEEIMKYHREKLAIFKLFWNYGFPYELTTFESQYPIPIPSKLKAQLRKQKLLFSSLKHLNIELVQKQVAEGAEVNCCSTQLFKFPLHNVVVLHCEEIYGVLLDGGLAVNSLDSEGRTPLQVAAELGSYQCCLLLLTYGAAYNGCSTKCPKTPLQLAEENNRTLAAGVLKAVDDCFKMMRNTRVKNLEGVKGEIQSKDIIWAVLNCSGKDGLSLIGKALKLGMYSKAQKLLRLKLQKELTLQICSQLISV